MFNEEELRYIWKKGLFSGKILKTVEGLELEVLLPGEENTHAGPDFFNARLRLGGIIWAGNVEVHRAASDWNRHGHQQDPAYDNVILHVIHHLDSIVRNCQGRQIQTLKVEATNSVKERVLALRKNDCWIPCSRELRNVPDQVIKSWLQILTSERIMEKIAHLSRLTNRQRFNSEHAFYLALASGFGLPINSLPFELVASKIPLSFLLEIKENLYDLEAYLFGTSGMLSTRNEDEPYVSMLLQRYATLRKELSVLPIPGHLWKFLRIRPATFPTIRLSQFASLIHSGFPLDSHSMSIKSASEFQHCLQVRASDYWNTHYIFGKHSPFSVKRFGKQSTHQLLINVIVPFIYRLQLENVTKRSTDHGKEILHSLGTETNNIINNWSKLGVISGSAFESQALIQLYKKYCLKKRCSDCQIGRELFR